jgi:hypothetical protein
MSPDNVKILEKDQLEGFLEGLLKDNIVFGPTRKGDLLLFDRVESANDISLGRGNTPIVMERQEWRSKDLRL